MHTRTHTHTHTHTHTQHRVRIRVRVRVRAGVRVRVRGPWSRRGSGGKRPRRASGSPARDVREIYGRYMGDISV